MAITSIFSAMKFGIWRSEYYGYIYVQHNSEYVLIRDNNNINNNNNSNNNGTERKLKEDKQVWKGEFSNGDGNKLCYLMT